MNFLYPLLLIAGIAIVAPIVIHLFNFKKYKKVFFPDIRFLKELQEQTHKSSRLKHLLILLCRIFAFLFLAFAFAQPFFSKDKDKISQIPKAISIYIDNSFSMGIEKNGISLLDLAKAKTKSLIQKMGDADAVQILTNDFSFSENKFMPKEEALRLLSTINITPKIKTPINIIEKQKQLLSTEGAFQKQIVYISDFQKSGFPLDTKTDDSIKKYFVAVETNSLGNISLDSAYFEENMIALNQENKLLVRVKNNGDEEMNTTLNLNVNNQLKNVSNISLKPNETKIEEVKFVPSQAGTQKIELYLNDYPLTYDDTFYIAAKVNASFSVLILNQNNANPYLNSVFKPNNQFKVDYFQIGNLNKNLLANYSLIILNNITSINEDINNSFIQYLNNGGSILCFAPIQNQTNSINTFLNKSAACFYENYDTSKLQVSSFAKSNEIFRDIFEKIPENIDLPIVFKRFSIHTNAMSSEQKLFSFSNGESFLSLFQVGNGKLYVCGSSAESYASTFPKSYWFLPLIYKMTFNTNSDAMNILTLNKNPNLIIQNTKTSDKTIYHLTQNQFDAVPEQRAMGNKIVININNAISKAGFYTLRLPDAQDTTSIAVNYDRSESALSYWKTDELKKTTKFKNAEWIQDKDDIADSVFILQQGMPLWKVCIILALLFLLTEIALIRLWK